MNKFVLKSLVILLLCASAALANADIYKYIDKNGVTHFTNVPKNETYEKIINENETSDNYYMDYDHIINSKSVKYNIRPSLIKAVITAESNWNPEAVSQKGAIGLMQLMPATARDMKVNNPYNPEENIEGGARYLRYLLDSFGDDLTLALAAYNAGPEKVKKSGGIPSISETRKYVKTVLSIYNGGSSSENSVIYKVTYENGTTLYTNVPSQDNKKNLPNF